jgi:hypothetical protein
MIRSVSAALAVALALSGTVAWECLDASLVDAPLPPLRPAAKVPSSHPEAPEARRERMEAQAAAVLARPLFSRTRRSPQEVEAGAVPDKPLLLRLTGTLVSQAGQQAIFAPATGGKTLAVGVGSRVGVFTVAAIAAGEVTVLDPGGGAQVLRPKADPAVRAAAAPAVPAASTAQAAPPSVLDLLRDTPGEGAKPGPPGAARPGAAR